MQSSDTPLLLQTPDNPPTGGGRSSSGVQQRQQQRQRCRQRRQRGVAARGTDAGAPQVPARLHLPILRKGLGQDKQVGALPAFGVGPLPCLPSVAWQRGVRHPAGDCRQGCGRRVQAALQQRPQVGGGAPTTYPPAPCRRRLRPPGQAPAAAPRLLALDCEMCATTKGDNELLSLAVVDQDGAVLMRVGARTG
jgi:hypothetical protein